jgi:hypothetical protein
MAVTPAPNPPGKFRFAAADSLATKPASARKPTFAPCGDRRQPGRIPERA